MQDIFERIPQRSTENEIVSRLRAAIIEGKVAPGAHLNESELAKQMAVSRIPIRESLRKLEQEGLITRLPNRGVFVRSFTAQDVREVFSLRAVLENMAFEWAIPRMSKEDIDVLEAMIDEQKIVIAEKRYEELAFLDMRFHEFLCKKANHSRLLKSWYEQHAQCQMLLNLRFKHMADYTPETVPMDHVQILDAIRRRDVATVVSLTLEISERVAQECVETLEQMQVSEMEVV